MEDNGHIAYTNLELDRTQRKRCTEIALRLIEASIARNETKDTYTMVKECLLAAVISVHVLEQFEATGLMDGSVPSREQFIRDLEHIQAVRQAVLDAQGRGE